MDHIPDLSAFQGVMLSADNHYSFAKLKSKGGNEDKIKYILDKIFNFLKEKNYITEHGLVEERSADFEKLALYLVLNADLPELASMTELAGVGARVWTLPTLPGALLAELLWGLRMGRCLYRAVAFCPPRLALQLADACVAHLRYMDPRQHLERPALLARALHRLLCRLPLARAPPPAAPAAAAAALRACLVRLRAAPTDDRVLSLPTDDQYKLLARTLTVMLRLIQDCLSRFTAVERLEDEEFTDMYLATHQPDGLGADTPASRVCDSLDPALLEGLHACNAFLLDDCAALVMEVSVDVYCAWSEYEDDGRSVQQAVGELCHEVRGILRDVPGAADHALVDMLAQIERKPAAIEDVVAAADADTIAERIRAGDEDGAAWLAALLRREDLCRQPALLAVLHGAAVVLDEDQGSRLFDRLAHRLRDESDGTDKGLPKTLAIKAFRRCGDSAKDRILAEQFREHFHDEFETAEFEEAAVDTFNRLVGSGGSGGAGLGDALAIFLQNPLRTLGRALRLAADGAAQAALMLRLVERLGECRGRRYPGDAAPALLLAADDALDAADAVDAGDGEARRERLAGFVSELARRELVAREAVLSLALPRLRAGPRALCSAARLLRACGAPPSAPLLGALAQALDLARAARAALHPDAPLALDLLLALQADLLDASCDHLSDKERQWLRAWLQRATPLTRCHFARLWPGPAGSAPALADLIRKHPVDVVLLAACEWDALLPRGCGASEMAAVQSALGRAARACGAPGARGALLGAHAAARRALQKQYLSSPATERQAGRVLELALALAGRDADLARGWAPLLAPLGPGGARLAAAACDGGAGARLLHDHIASLCTRSVHADAPC